MVGEGKILLSLLLALVGISGSYIGMLRDFFAWVVAN